MASWAFVLSGLFSLLRGRSGCFMPRRRQFVFPPTPSAPYSQFGTGNTRDDKCVSESTPFFYAYFFHVVFLFHYEALRSVRNNQKQGFKIRKRESSRVGESTLGRLLSFSILTLFSGIIHYVIPKKPKTSLVGSHYCISFDYVALAYP